MPVYKRYNTRKKRLGKKIIIPLVCIAISFLFAVLLGNHLGKKAKEPNPQYTGQDYESGEVNVINPLSEKSLHGIYVEADELEDFEYVDEDTWASVWVYKDSEAVFATELDKKLGKETKKKPSLSAFDIQSGTIGLFEVNSLFSEESISKIAMEYEKALIAELATSSLDEIVLIFKGANSENYKDVLAYCEDIICAKVVCVPYEMISNQEFFSAAAQKGFSIALFAEDISGEQLASDIETYAFYFTKYNLRLVLSGGDKALLDVLAENSLLNYQFYS